MACDWNVFVSDKSSRNSYRYNDFDITNNLLKRNPIIQKVENLSSQFSTEDQMKKIASANLLIHVLTNDPERSQLFRQTPPKQIRTNFFFIIDISKTSLSDINADNNDTYLKSCNTSSSVITTTIELVLFVKISVANFIITKDCHEILTKMFTSNR